MRITKLFDNIARLTQQGVKKMISKFLIISALGLGLLSAPAFGANPARPGTVNYVEGEAYANGQQLTDKSVGSTDLNPGEELTTKKGKAEILLTPGVFLRLDDHSAVKMISPDLTKTQVELTRGRAGVEVDEVHRQNNLEIIVGDVTTKLEKNGYYEFDANQPTALVFKGKAAVEATDGKYETVKDHHELALTPQSEDGLLAKEKPSNFNTGAAQDELYNWSSLRSEYLAEANNQIAGEYAGVAGFAPGWYWNPYGWDYTFIGADPFWSPFGWGFYPVGWGGYYGGFYGYPYRGHYGYRGGYNGRGRIDGFHGGGFNGGGFHGGGFAGGGGFHGGGGHR